MLRRLYDWCIAAADKPYATWLMGVVSFVESSFFPIPPDAMLIPMSLARPDKAFYYATVCTVTSVAGGVLGYLIGAVLYDFVGQWLMISTATATRSKLSVKPMRSGGLDHPDQGRDADPLQDRDHRVGLCRLQSLHVRAAVVRRARHALLSRWRSCSTATASRRA